MGPPEIPGLTDFGHLSKGFWDVEGLNRFWGLCWTRVLYLNFERKALLGPPVVPFYMFFFGRVPLLK